MSYIHRPSHIFIASDGGAVKELIPEQSIDSPIGVRLSQMTFVNSFGSFPEGENVISFEIRWLTGAQGNVSYVTRNVTLTLETDVRYTSGSIVSTLGSLLAKDDVANGYTDKTSDHLVFKYHTDENILLWECLGVVNVKVTRGNKRLGYSDRAMGGVPYPSSDHMKTTFTWAQNYNDLNIIPQAELDAFGNHVDIFFTPYQMYLACTNLLYAACSLSSNASVHSTKSGGYANDIFCSIPVTGSFGDIVAFNNLSQMPVGLAPQWITRMDFVILDDDLKPIDLSHPYEMCVELYYNTPGPDT